MSKASNVNHPGIRIRTEVIPKGMSVTKAAELMGVGRPALSNLLNGNASLSPDMATRLEKAFGHPLKDLMDMQARYDAAQATLQVVPSDIKPYVPPFLAIKANAIEAWVSHNIPARIRLAVLLRTLVHSTGSGLTKVDFPGNDDAERPGWDGEVQAGVGTPWIPVGKSGWEFGTNQDPKTKADGDFEKSVKAHERKVRMEMTFVFVTPRRWSGKGEWVTAKKATKNWKDVRAYDASDLEQWLEQSLPGQAWFANETGIPAEDVRSLERCWSDWAQVSTPPLTGALFDPAIDAAKRTVLARLSKAPERPIVVSADSNEEALAFLAQLLGERGDEELASFRDRLLVFGKAGVMPRLAAGAQTFIPVATTREVERELAAYATSIHSFVIYPRNAAPTEPDIVLEPIGYEAFNKALEEMGKGRDEVSRLAKESGRSLTVLRRRLSNTPAMKTPEWAADHRTAATLVPFVLVGAWNSQNTADITALSLLAGDRSYAELEKEVQSLVGINDAPMWAAGTFRGVVSKIDLLFAIATAITAPELDRYFSMAEMVLGEDDPALDLEEDKRWAAAMFDKRREFSSTFRAGISETLVLLAVHGGALFDRRTGLSMETRVTQLVRKLLPDPLTLRALEANDRDLSTYAEAAPDEFLTILERDLRKDAPVMLGLLRPVEAGSFGSSPARSGLLWALEGLSWSPSTLPRTVFILARLSEIEINDNWTNKPANSLAGIFRDWMPQTAATVEERIALIRRLAEKFPAVTWKICISQFGAHHDVGHYSHKPRWRADGYGYGEPIPTWPPIMEFRRAAVEMALNWKDHTLSTLCDLVERLSGLPDEYRNRAWELVRDWATTRATDAEKAAMREKVRVTALSHRAAARVKKAGAGEDLVVAARNIYAALEPLDLQQKHHWLFRSAWVDESADEMESGERYDHRKRDERIANLRKEALREIFQHEGLIGLLEFSEQGEAAWLMGMLLVDGVLSEVESDAFLRMIIETILGAEGQVSKSNGALFRSLVRALRHSGKQDTALTLAVKSFRVDEAVRLLLLAPFDRGTWALVDGLRADAQEQYWSEVTPDWVHEDAESTEAVQRLLKANRPRAAFSCVHYRAEQLDASILHRLLTAMAHGGNDRPGEYLLEHYRVEEAFKHLHASATLSLEEKATLEFAYIDALARPWDRGNDHGIPNLARYVEEHPEVFVQAIAWTYRRSDGGADPDGLAVAPEHVKGRAERGYKLLKAMERIPGHNDVGVLEAARLKKWISEVRRSSEELARRDVADISIGQVLSHAPVGSDGVWPCEPVRD
ncbi:MAG TPA: HigA family addiction module antitoxin, partial [Tahibacter sp.]|nr:HigA family addiction module antitoxin [Tahibacter sp.]